MSEYKLGPYGSVIRLRDNICIPNDSANFDRITYLAWVQNGGVPDEADKLPFSSALAALSNDYKNDIANLQLKWLSVSVIGGQYELSSKSTVITAISARKIQYIADLSALRIQYGV